MPFWMQPTNLLHQNYGSLDIWRGQTGLSKESHLVEYDAEHYLVKEEVTHYGAKKLILKNKVTGKISEREIN